MSQDTPEVRGVRIAPARLSERSSRRRRSLDERLYVRFPSLCRLLAARFLDLAPRSSLRRAMLARSMARAYAAANRRDFEVILILNDDERYEYRPSRDLLPPDMETVYHGHEGYRRFWRLWLDAFHDIRWEPQEILDFGEQAWSRRVRAAAGRAAGSR